MTNSPAVEDQIDVQRVVFFRRDQLFNHLMSQFVADFFRQQTHSPQNSENVSIHRKDRMFATEQQNAGGCLWPYTFQRNQKITRFINSGRLQKGQVQIPAPSPYIVQDIFDDHGFDVCQAAGLDCDGDACRSRSSDVLPVRKASFQTGERSVAVYVGRGLGKDCVDEFVQRVFVAVVRRNAVSRFQVLSYEFELPPFFSQFASGIFELHLGQRPSQSEFISFVAAFLAVVNANNRGVAVDG